MSSLQVCEPAATICTSAQAGTAFTGEDTRQRGRLVAIKFVRAFALSSSRLDSCVAQEPRKSDAPQLRDEYRSYRTLRGIGMCRLCNHLMLHRCLTIALFSHLVLAFGQQRVSHKFITLAKKACTMSLSSTCSV